MSTTASRVRKGRANETSTCAGSPRWSRKPIAFSCAAACSFTQATGAKGYGEGPHPRWSTRPIPSPFIIEQAGGAATDTVDAHSRSDTEDHASARAADLRFGAGSGAHQLDITPNPSNIGERAPLFSKRGLFQGLMEEEIMSAKHPIISITGSSRRRNDLRQAHFRADFPPREHRGRFHRRRRLPHAMTATP